MHRCLSLAKMGLGNVAPNPLVGAVIVHNDKIIGEGFHQQYGGPHAEVNAVNSVDDASLLAESTIYVSLEPCAHFGKTPPCADLIVKHQFKKVVIACPDSFSEVNGKGIERLRNAGIEVVEGILEREALELNRRFFTFHTKKRPYVILKWAQTLDGFLDRKRTESEQGINWITKPETKQLVHKWRAEESAILVGKNTVIVDNPSLTVREWKGKNPTRIVLDAKLELSENHAIFDQGATTIVLNKLKTEEKGNVKFIQLSDLMPETILKVLHSEGIQSVIIEGGALTLQSFITSNLWDEARILTGKIKFGEGLDAPAISGKLINEFSFGEDLTHIYRNI